MKNLKKALVVLALLSAGNAYALGAVSRACQFSTIPSGQKSLASVFFVDLGADLSVLQLPYQSAEIQQTYWIHEALTTDYFSVRYYLYAMANVYSLKSWESTYAGNWMFYAQYISGQEWLPKTISNLMKYDSKYAMYFANRGMLYSARAGLLSIGEYISPQGMAGYVVTGYHWYYDPVSKVTGQLVSTRARDCNLQNWGQDTGLWDR